MLRKFIVIIISAMLFLASCGEAGNQDMPDAGGESSNTTSVDSALDDGGDYSGEITLSAETDEQEEEILDFDDVQAMYPDKTVLVWIHQDSMYQQPLTAKVNEYLDSLGCDFAVCFVPVSVPWELKLNQFGYADRYREMISSGEQVDIIFSDIIYVWQGGAYSYYRDYFDGLYLCLDDYLTNTEHGKELYDMFPEKYWDTLRIDGKIYGVDGSLRSLSLNRGYLYNAELVEKYDYDITIRPCMQIDKLKEIAENEGIVPFFSYSNLYSTPLYTDSTWLSYGVVFDEAEKRAISVLEDEEYLSNIEEIYTLLQNGLLNSEYRSDFFAKRDMSYVSLENGVEIEYTNDDGSTMNMLPQMKNDPVMHCPNYVNAVSSSSEHPDEAFQLLCLCLTDGYLSDLLAYGEEGVDYNVVDGYADNTRNIIDMSSYVSRLVSTPNDFENSMRESTEQYRETLESARVVDSQSFVFNASAFKTENYDIYLALEDMSNEAFSVPDLSFEEFIEKYKQVLDEAGIQKIINEANRQYELYAQSQPS